MKKRLLQLFLALLLISFSMEFLVRYLGAVDFPVYHADNKIGYIPKANQRGSFLGKNDWEVNSFNMANGDFSPDEHLDTLLIGDSIVWGGNPYAADERLGPQLKKRSSGAVWSVAAGSWTLRNEVTYLLQHKEDVVDQVDRIVFVLNSGDFTGASSWNCELTHPTRTPSIALAYLFQKYIFSLGSCGQTPEALRVPGGYPFADVSNLLNSTDKQVIVFLYPTKEEFSNPKLLEANFDQNERRLKDLGINNVIYIHRDPRWNEGLYKDDVHPTAEGMGILAEIMARNLSTNDLQ